MTNHRTITYKGKEYILTQQPYIMGINEEPYYVASVIDSEGKEYDMEWDLNEDTREAYNEIEKQRELGETPNYSLVEDESTACDWDTPVDVKEIYCD